MGRSRRGRVVACAFYDRHLDDLSRFQLQIKHCHDMFEHNPRINVWDWAFWILMASLVLYFAKRAVSIYDSWKFNPGYRHDDFKFVNF
ncbi:hypothetical protein LEN26_008375 [Aphanomyces euteiches]|nr:hypothetical protein AeMF1_001533 [Aphanomyces euteiches]KAH9130585.1 hypothetical protein LEN26_008375 [Aphanomyces euteiches]KAH9183636.1 hypothetical protein AeNC1_014388 [Aphanomyces euteiches]